MLLLKPARLRINSIKDKIAFSIYQCISSFFFSSMYFEHDFHNK